MPKIRPFWKKWAPETQYNTELATAKKMLFQLKTMELGNSTHVTKLTAVVDDAEQLGGPPDHDYSAALEKLKNAKGIFKEGCAQAGKLQDRALQETEYKPIYEDKVRRIDDAIERLEALPGTEKARQGLAELKANGESIATSRTPDYEAAYNALKGLSGLLKKGLGDSKSFVKHAGDKDFRILLGTAQQKLADYKNLLGFAKPEEVKEIGVDINDAIKLLEPGNDELDTAMLKLRAAIGQMTPEIEAATVNQTACQALKTSVHEKLREARKYGPATILQPWLTAYRVATAKMSAQDYAAARHELGTLETLIDGPANLPALKANFETWQQESAKITTADGDGASILQRLQSLSSGMIPIATDVRSRASDLLVDYSNAKAVLADKDHDFAAAHQVATDVFNQFTQNVRPELADYEALEDIRRDGDDDLEKDYLGPIEELLNQLATKKGDVSVHRQAIAVAMSEWRKARLEKTTQDDLDDALNDAKTALDAIKQDLTDILGDDAQLALSVEDAKALEVNGDISKLTATVDALIQAFELSNRQLAGEYRQTIADWDELADAAQSKKRLEKMKVKLEAAIQQVAGEARELASQLEKEIKATEKKVTSTISSNKPFKPLLSRLEEQLASCHAMTQSSSLSVVKNCESTLADINARHAAWAADLAAVKEKLKELSGKTRLDHDDLKMYGSRTRENLMVRLKQEIQPEVYQAEPQHALNVILASFEKQVLDAVAAAKVAKTDLQTIKTKGDHAIKQLDEIKNAEALCLNFRARICSAMAPAEGREKSAITDLDSIVSLIEALKQDADKLESAEKTARKEELANAQAQPSFDAKLAVFEKSIFRSAKAAYEEVSRSQRNKSLMQEIEQAVKDAKRHAKKGQFVVADDKIKDAIRLAKALIANPYNDRVSAKKGLTKANKRWKAACAHFIRTVIALVAEIKGSAADAALRAEDVNDVETKLLALTWLFDAGAFDKTMATLQDDRSITTHRTSKETGLRTVRRYQRQVEQHPLILYLQKDSPFNSVVSVTELSSCLTDLEVNLRSA